MAKSLVEDLHRLLEDHLHIHSIFPSVDSLQEGGNTSQSERSNPLTGNERVARIMLEKKDVEKAKAQKDGLDDVILRLRALSSSLGRETGATEEGQQQQQRGCHSLPALQVMEKIQEKLSNGLPIERLPLLRQSVPISETLPTQSPHPGLAKILRLFYNDHYAMIIHSYAKHSLLSVSRFHASTTLSSGMLGNTTGIGCKDLRLRFIIYQLFHAVCFLHEQGFCLTSLSPGEILLDDEMWLTIPLGISNRLMTALGGDDESCRAATIPRPIGYYEPLTIQWISGKITNLDYLMAINYAAGRTMVDPLYHPLIPWEDFVI
eukprot:scaffold1127_cov186-Ochromonas_danica.AAC.4